MQMKAWKSQFTRRLLVPVVAVATIGTFGAYEFTKPARAAAAAPAPAAAPLDTNSVSALMTLDHEMETLAARVTPAVVNITVTSKPTSQPAAGGDADNDSDLTCSNSLLRLAEIPPMELRLAISSGNSVACRNSALSTASAAA